jgi:hypothetical protein
MLIASFEEVGSAKKPATIVVNHIVGIRQTMNPEFVEIDTIGGPYQVYGDYDEIVNFIAQLLDPDYDV